MLTHIMFAISEQGSNRYEETDSEPDEEIRSIWLGRQSIFQTFNEDLEVDTERIRQLLDDDND